MARATRVALAASAAETIPRLVDAVNWLLAAVSAAEEAQYVLIDVSLGPLAIGTFMGYDGGWVVADNTDKDRRARCVVADAGPQGYLAVSYRRRLAWPAHGIGAAGTEFWLGTAGGVVTAEPTGPTVYVSQRLGIVVDADNVLLEWDTPLLEVA